MNYKDLTQSIIAVLIVTGTILSFFVAVNPIGEQVLRVLAGAVVGFYFGAGTIPMFGARKP